MPTDNNVPAAAFMDDLASIVPALAAYAADSLDADLWMRPELSLRDRCVVTVSVLIAKGQMLALPHYLDKALDSGVTAAELAEIVTHLAFYTGWMTAYAAVAPLKAVFSGRGVPAAQSPLIPLTPLRLDEQAEAKRAATVQQNLGEVAPGVVKYTTELLFNDLWLRPQLTPRDRGLVTICALTATAQVAQISFHLNRAMDNGLTKAEASEVFTHMAFYTGWPGVMSALPVVKDVFAARGAST